MKNGTTQTLSVPEAAKILGIGIAHAYRMVNSGEIPAIRVGKRWLIPKKALDTMLEPPPPVTAYAPPALNAEQAGHDLKKVMRKMQAHEPTPCLDCPWQPEEAGPTIEQLQEQLKTQNRKATKTVTKATAAATTAAIEDCIMVTRGAPSTGQAVERMTHFQGAPGRESEANKLLAIVEHFAELGPQENESAARPNTAKRALDVYNGKGDAW